MATRYAVTTGNWNDAIWAATATGAAGSAAVPTTSDDAYISRQILLSNVVIATDVFSSTAHGLVDGDVVWVTTVGNAITPLSPFTDYYVVSSSANDFKLSLTAGGAAIDITGTGSGNRYVIPKVTVSLDNTTCVANTVTINSILSTLTSANTTLTTQLGITQSIGSFASFDVSASSYIHTIYMNQSNNATAYGYYVPTGAKYTFHGKTKTRWTRVNGATSASDTSFAVDDATGWVTGDRLFICTTQAQNTTPKVDYLQNVTVTGTTIDLTSATPTSLAYAHADNAYIGNFSSNIRIGVSTSTYKSYFHAVSIPNSTMQYASNTVSDVEFFDLYGYTASPNASLYFNGTPTGCSLEFTNNAIFNASHCIYGSFNGTLTMNNNVYAMHNATIQNNTSMVHTNHFIENTVNDTDSIFFGGQGANYAMSSVQNRTGTMTRLRFSGYSSSTGRATVFGSGADNSAIFESCAWWSNGQDVGTSYNAWPAVLYRNSTFGTEFPGANSARTFGVDYPAKNRFENCTFGTPDVLFYGSNQGTWGNTVLLNKDGDTTSQEVYTGESYTIPTFSRDNSTFTRALSSLKIFGTTYGVDRDITLDILVAGSATITIVGYCQVDTNFYNGGTWYAPTAVVKQGDTVLDTYTATSAASGAWEKIELSATNPSASPKILTLYLRANRYGSSGFCWFSGIPIYPYANACRHYGFLFDEANPTRTVDTYISASEATASAYTGVTINNTTKQITFGAGTADTAQKFYDFSRDWCVDDLTRDVPFTRAGTLYSMDADWSVIDPYYAGELTWSGGTVQYTSTGTKSDNLDGNIIEFNVAGGGTFPLEGTISGTLDLRNLDASVITVELPSGTSYTTANNTGGAITVTVPVVTADISITGMPTAAAATTRLQIINSTALAASAWTALTAYAVGDIVKRTTGIGTENTAGLYFRCTDAGNSGGTEPVWDTTVGNVTTDATVEWTTYSILFYDADPVTSSLTDTYLDGEEFLAGESIEVRFAEMDGSTSFKTYSTTTVASSAGFSALVAGESDSVYATFALDGSDYETTYTPDFVYFYLIMDANLDFSGKSAYAYFCYTLTSSLGMYWFWGGMTALDAGNIRINDDVLDMFFNEDGGFVKQTDDVRIFRSDGTRPAIDPTTGGNGIEINWRTPVSVITTSDQAVNLATVQAGLTAQGYTTTRAPKLDDVVSEDGIDDLFKQNS